MVMSVFRYFQLTASYERLFVSKRKLVEIFFNRLVFGVNSLNIKFQKVWCSLSQDSGLTGTKKLIFRGFGCKASGKNAVAGRIWGGIQAHLCRFSSLRTDFKFKNYQTCGKNAFQNAFRFSRVIFSIFWRFFRKSLHFARKKMLWVQQRVRRASERKEKCHRAKRAKWKLREC